MNLINADMLIKKLEDYVKSLLAVGDYSGYVQINRVINFVQEDVCDKIANADHTTKKEFPVFGD